MISDQNKSKQDIVFSLIERPIHENKIYYSEVDFELDLFGYVAKELIYKPSMKISLNKLECKIKKTQTFKYFDESRRKTIFNILEEYCYSSKKIISVANNSITYFYRVPVRYYMNSSNNANYTNAQLYKINMHDELIVQRIPFFSKHNYKKYNPNQFVVYSIKMINNKFPIKKPGKFKHKILEKNHKAKKINNLRHNIICQHNEHNTPLNTSNILYRIFDIDCNDDYSDYNDCDVDNNDYGDYGDYYNESINTEENMDDYDFAHHSYAYY